MSLMSINLEIPESLFSRIQKHAIPFVDLTPIAVIERWANHFEKNQSKDQPITSVRAFESDAKKFNPMTPPDLMHTRCQGTFGNAQFRKWNDLVRVAHTHAFKRAQSFETLKTVTHAQIRKGDHSGDSGYHFVPEVDISIQGVDANHAWLYAFRLAQYLKTPVRVAIEWRQNEKAAFPGEMGVIEWMP